MSLNRIWIGQQVDVRLRTLKARTGLTPNLLCRLAFCLSLTEPGVPDPQLYADGQVREFNRFTLTGQYDLLFFSLLRERLAQDNLDPETELEDQFKAHLSRGVVLLHQRIRSLRDLEGLFGQNGAEAISGVTSPWLSCPTALFRRVGAFRCACSSRVVRLTAHGCANKLRESGPSSIVVGCLRQRGPLATDGYQHSRTPLRG